MSGERSRVVVVDDHVLVRNAIRVMSQGIAEVEIIGEAATGLEALECCHRISPDVVLMDIDMPEMDGIEAIRRLREEMPGVRVLVLTVHDDEDAILEAINAGAAGYVPKSASLSELRSAIGALHVGGAYLDPRIADLALHGLAARAETAREAARVASESTTREREVLELLAQGMSARAIAGRLGISERTVSTHVGHIYRRLGVNNRVDAVREAMRLGLVACPR